MAMEQGEKRTIHPFFCKGMSPWRRYCTQFTHIGTDFGVQPKSAHQPTSVADSVPSHDISNRPVHHDTVTEDCRQPANNSDPLSIPTLSTITLEDDPNSSRRKRRRTDQHDASGIATGTLSDAEEGNTTASNPVIKYNDATRPIIESRIPVTKNADHTELQVPTIEDPTPTGPANDATAQTEGRYPERQRTLRLNPNGKLLSSPIGKLPQENEPMKKEKGKKGSRKSKKDGNKLIIIKYSSDENARERIGKIIDDILNGRRRHQTQRLASVPTPKQTPQLAVNQPPKPTHPFFSKKSTRKPDTSTQPYSEDSAASKPLAETSRRPLSLTREGSGVASIHSVRPRVSKFPEPIHPLWPPRDFVHVRGVDADVDPYRDSLYSNADQRKAKGVSVRIHDKENVLLSGTFGQSIKREVSQPLRLPTRFVASGKVSGKALTSQLSGHSSRPENGGPAIKKDAHPGISRLYSSLETTMTAFDRGQCETCLWTQKYAPTSAEEVLQTGKEAHMLRDWLKFLIISAVDTGKSSKDAENAKQQLEEKKRAKKRQKKDKLDGFIVSSGDEASEMGELESEEDELAGDVTVSSSKRTVIRSGDLPAGGRMTNAILLSGPAGSGKTASVHAVAKELGFEVFEINSGNRRNGRDVVERVGDMTRNHIVHKLHFADEGSSQLPEASNQEAEEDGKQNKLMGFFKPKPADTKQRKESTTTPKEAEPEADAKRSQKQSLILLEEADILFEEDRQFWSGVMSLIQQSRRPIIITCNNEKLIPLESISFHAILRYRPPPQDLAVDYLLLMAANEGHMLQRKPVSDLYHSAGSDLRRAIMDLNFWCQMAIGSKKSGLDWLMDRWPPGRDCDENGDTLRVLSLNTYQQYMGWFGRDMLLNGSLDSEVESRQESFHWWERSIQDSENMAFSNSHTLSPAKSKHEQLEQLQYESEYADMRSTLDILCTGCSVDTRLVGY